MKAERVRSCSIVAAPGLMRVFVAYGLVLGSTRGAFEAAYEF
jgi:hypothetical protein